MWERELSRPGVQSQRMRESSTERAAHVAHPSSPQTKEAQQLSRSGQNPIKRLTRRPKVSSNEKHSNINFLVVFNYFMY